MHRLFFLLVILLGMAYHELQTAINTGGSSRNLCSRLCPCLAGLLEGIKKLEHPVTIRLFDWILKACLQEILQAWRNAVSFVPAQFEMR